MYRLTPDPVNHRLVVEFIDSHADIDQAELNHELRKSAIGVKGRGAHFDLIVDFTRTTVMPQTLTSTARDGMDWCIANGLRRSASVMNSVITKMQVDRLAIDDRFRTFTNRTDAIAWLRSPG